MESPSESKATKMYDLLILVDGTYSMSNYLKSLNISLPKILSVSTLTDSFSRIGLLAYRDYCDRKLIEWSEWFDTSDPDQGQPDIIQKAKDLEPIGGGDYPEATKTGLAKAYEVMRAEATTIILLYTDAPPHIKSVDSEYFGKEQTALRNHKAYGGFGKLFMDWISACNTLQKDKKAKVFSILEPNMDQKYGNYYNYISEMTGGACFYLKDSQAQTISKVTMDLLLAWMQVEKPGSDNAIIGAKIHKYKDIPDNIIVKNESALPLSPFFNSSNISQLDLTSDILKKVIPKREPPVQDFAKRYTSDSSYKLLVVKQLKNIINQDVSAISLNPVFGSLWRAVCNDRENPAREELIQSFGLQIEKIRMGDEKERMKNWLAESYDYTAEVLDIISTVPADQLFPCVFLDPTLKFEKPNDAEGPTSDAADDSRPITTFTRDELLEIGRSCDFRILRRLGRVLTRLSFANSAEDLPAHIAKEKDDAIVKIPLALASKDLGRKFWKILLHIVVPGTMLSSRPSALLAALSIRLGVQPLLQAAENELLLWRHKWNDLEIPETWNMSCLSLLLDADAAYANRARQSIHDSADNGPAGLLLEDDKVLFERLVSYKMLELNLKTTLVAKIGWKPEKTIMSIGQIFLCKSCLFPRSVTMMAANGICGLCDATDYLTPEMRNTRIHDRVSKEDNEQTNATWVECAVRTCRAQYVVYHPAELKVRPKCFYCREQSSVSESDRDYSPAPCVECRQCLSRIIWPEEYRPESLEGFICVACSQGKKTIIEVETSANGLCEENDRSWLLSNHNARIENPFSGRSLFHVISNAGTASFCEDVTLFPQTGSALSLTLTGKVIRNPSEVCTQLMSWVQRRQTESGICSLCFTSFRKDLILPSCGRSGCNQRICKDCLSGWYGLNSPGSIINTAALSCPFCRRPPAAKTLAKYGMGIHAVAGLRTAVDESGKWIFAWCTHCGHAKRYMERVCAAGAPAEVRLWKCEDCKIYKDAQAKQCPGCGVMTEKAGGCNHITCTVPGCGAHWCFFCGEKSEEYEIYDHMENEHGGLYDDGMDDDE